MTERWNRRLAFVLIFAILFTIIPAGAAASNPVPVLPLEPAGGQTATVPGGGDAGLLVQAHGQLPLSFERNQGQLDPRVRFAARYGGGILYFTTEEVAMVFSRQKSKASSWMARIRDWRMRLIPDDSGQLNEELEQLALIVRFSGALPTAHLEGLDPLPGTVNYFIGDDPTAWQAGVSTFGSILYRDLYPSIDLHYYEVLGRLKYDFVLHPGAEAEQIALTYDGAESLHVNSAGQLVIQTAWGTLVEDVPVAWQEGAWGRRQPVAARYVLRSDGRVGFHVGPYDPTLGLVIDPSLDFSTFVGGSGEESGYVMALDSSGNAIVTGRVASTNFPTAGGAYDPGHNGDFDAFVLKLSADGRSLLYSTYVGGSKLDRGTALALDSSGNATVAGDSKSSNFPTTGGAFDRGHNGGSDIFVLKLSADGRSLMGSTFVGGSGDEETWGVVLDAAGNPLVAGQSDAANFPTTDAAWDQGHNGGDDIVVFKVSSSLASLLFSTYIGGKQDDRSKGVVLDGSGRPVITGGTWSSDFPTTSGAYDRGHNGGEDTYVLRLSADGGALSYSTYFGGSGDERGWSPILDGDGRPIITGRTFSPDLPTTNGAFDRTYNGDEDAFLTKLAADGGSLVLSTYLGGSGREIGHKPAVDGDGNLLLTGRTSSPNFPTTPDALDRTHGGDKDVFVLKLSPDGSALQYSTYIGGSGKETGRWLEVVDGTGVVVSGSAGSSSFPTTTGAYDRTHNGNLDVFVLRFDGLADPGAECFALTTDVEPPGSGRVDLLPSPNCPGNASLYRGGTAVRLTSVPSRPGCSFRQWGGDVWGVSNPTTISMDRNRSVTANFECGGGRHVSYLPSILGGPGLYPPVNVREHSTGSDGRISLPLTGGGTATFEFLDLLDRPVANIPIVSMENEFGVTVLAMPQALGYAPVLASVPASEYKIVTGHGPHEFSILRGFRIWELEPETPMWIKFDYIAGVLESLGQGAKAWFRQTMTAKNICIVSAEGATIILVHYGTAGLSLSQHVAVHAGAVIVSHSACELLFGGSSAEQEYSVISNRDSSFASTAIGAEPRTIIVEWRPDLKNTKGILFGQVLDKWSGSGIEGAAVKLDGLPQYSSTTFRGGGYRFEGVAPGTYSLSVSRAGYTSDSVANISVSANQMTEVSDLEIQPSSWGIWRITNDTGGSVTIDMKDIGFRTIGPGTHDWRLPPGKHEFVAWTTSCGGTVTASVTIHNGYITPNRFYCGQKALSFSETEP